MTVGDESVTERIVIAKDSKEASVSAIANVGAQNLGKGLTPTSESRANTTVLAVKEAGKEGVLVINRFPVTALKIIASNMYGPTNIEQEFLDHKTDLLDLAGLPEGSSIEEAILVLSTMLSNEATC